MRPCFKLIALNVLLGLAAGPSVASEGNPPTVQGETPAVLSTEQQATTVVGLARELGAR